MKCDGKGWTPVHTQVCAPCCDVAGFLRCIYVHSLVLVELHRLGRHVQIAKDVEKSSEKRTCVFICLARPASTHDG